MQQQPQEQLHFKALPIAGGRSTADSMFPRFKLEDHHDEDVVQSVGSPGPHPIKPCSSNFIRLSHGAIPSNSNIARQWSVPIGVVVHPMAPSDWEIPVVDFNHMGKKVIRCTKCRTYINPFFTFTDGGHRMVCNVCKTPNVVPPEYFCALDQNGVRHDHARRPELNSCTIELVAPPEYMNRPCQDPAYLFALDVSAHAVRSGMLKAACAALREHVNALPGGDRTLFGLLTYDSTVHFYNLSPKLSTAKMMVCPEITFELNAAEVENVELPFNEGLLVPLRQSKDLIEDLLDRIPRLWENNKSLETCFGPALCAGAKILGPIGGKLVMVLSEMPSFGVGRLHNRDDKKLYGTDKEKTLLQPQDEWYRKKATACSEDQVCIDVFLGGQQYMDTATISQLPKVTGGQMHFYRGFSVDRGDDQRMQHDMARLMTRETGFEAVMRLRTAVGLKITNFFGNFHLRGKDLLALPNIDEDKAFGFEVALQPNTMLNGNTACFQTALLYTHVSGQRRIRVHTVNVPVTSSMPQMYRLVDWPCMWAVMLRNAIEQAAAEGLTQARSAILDKLVAMLKNYRSCLPASQDAKTLILPDSMQLLPLLLCAAFKNPVLRCNTEGVDPDERAAHHMRAMTTPVAASLRFHCPAIYDVIATLEEGTPQLLSVNGRETLSPTKILLIDNSWQHLFWIGRRVAPQHLDAVFGVESSEDAKEVVAENIQNQALWDLLRHLESPKTSWQFPTTTIIRAGVSPLERLMLRGLIEDELASTVSYSNFLGQLHRLILA